MAELEAVRLSLAGLVSAALEEGSDTILQGGQTAAACNEMQHRAEALAESMFAYRLPVASASRSPAFVDDSDGRARPIPSSRQRSGLGNQQC